MNGPGWLVVIVVLAKSLVVSGRGMGHNGVMDSHTDIPIKEVIIQVVSKGTHELNVCKASLFPVSTMFPLIE